MNGHITSISSLNKGIQIYSYLNVLPLLLDPSWRCRVMLAPLRGVRPHLHPLTECSKGSGHVKPPLMTGLCVLFPRV